jgi:hypothetical protein
VQSLQLLLIQQKAGQSWALASMGVAEIDDATTARMIAREKRILCEGCDMWSNKSEWLVYLTPCFYKLDNVRCGVRKNLRMIKLRRSPEFSCVVVSHSITQCQQIVKWQFVRERSKTSPLVSAFLETSYPHGSWLKWGHLDPRISAPPTPCEYLNPICANSHRSHARVIGY